MKINILDFNQIDDVRGALISLEEQKNIPFKIKRVYYIFNTPTNISRGFHAHKKLEQVAVCMHGSCKFRLDDGNNTQIICLTTPHKGLFIDKMIWHEMFDFSKNCVIMVLASELYDENDYIREYKEFKSLI